MTLDQIPGDLTGIWVRLTPHRSLWMEADDELRDDLVDIDGLHGVSYGWRERSDYISVLWHPMQPGGSTVWDAQRPCDLEVIEL